MKARGQVKAARYPVPGHGTDHHSTCELNAELLTVQEPRATEKGRWRKDETADLSS